MGSLGPTGPAVEVINASQSLTGSVVAGVEGGLSGSLMTIGLFIAIVAAIAFLGLFYSRRMRS